MALPIAPLGCLGCSHVPSKRRRMCFPECDWLPGLDDRFYGVFVGASIYELAQVYGTAVGSLIIAPGFTTGTFWI
jgi:hypothetical protein